VLVTSWLDAARQLSAAALGVGGERKAGELLRDLEKDEGGRPPKNSYHDGMSLSEYRQVLEQNDIAPMTAWRWGLLTSVTHLCYNLYAERRE